MKFKQTTSKKLPSDKQCRSHAQRGAEAAVRPLHPTESGTTILCSSKYQLLIDAGRAIGFITESLLLLSSQAKIIERSQQRFQSQIVQTHKPVE